MHLDQKRVEQRTGEQGRALEQVLDAWNLQALCAAESVSPDRATAITAFVVDHFSQQFLPSRGLRVEYDHRVQPHPHACTHYTAIGSPDTFVSFQSLLEDRDYFTALQDLLAARALNAREITFHLPTEVQFEKHRDLEKGLTFMRFVDYVGRKVGVLPVWENAPLVQAPDWSLVLQNDFVPAGFPLCFDIGHIMLGAESKQQSLILIEEFLERHGANIRHLHLHVNDFKRDLHRNHPAEVISFLGMDLFRRLTEERTYIFEKGS